MCVCVCVCVCMHACVCACMHVCVYMGVSMRACVCMSKQLVCEKYNVMTIYYFRGFNVPIFVDLVKCSVLTLVSEIRCCRNDRYQGIIIIIILCPVNHDSYIGVKLTCSNHEGFVTAVVGSVA